jgi:hypothetical protein
VAGFHQPGQRRDHAGATLTTAVNDYPSPVGAVGPVSAVDGRARGPPVDVESPFLRSSNSRLSSATASQLTAVSRSPLPHAASLRQS